MPVMPTSIRITPSPKERGVFSSLMSGLDPRGSGKIEAGPAAEFLRKSGVETSHLRDIWDLATPNNEDFLDRDRFYYVLRLVGLA